MTTEVHLHMSVEEFEQLRKLVELCQGSTIWHAGDVVQLRDEQESERIRILAYGVKLELRG